MKNLRYSSQAMLWQLHGRRTGCLNNTNEFFTICYQNCIILVTELILWNFGMNTLSNLIKDRINNYPQNTLFSIKDFSDLASYKTAKVILTRLEKENLIKREIDGLYSKPEYSDFLQEFVAIPVDNIATKPAQKFSWHIAPSGNTALNKLKLSTQVPAHYVYLSDGPYRDYNLDGTSLEFKHTNNKMISTLSQNSNLIVQAIKALGKENYNAQVRNTIRNYFSDDELQIILSETQYITAWIYEIIKDIAARVPGKA